MKIFFLNKYKIIAVIARTIKVGLAMVIPILFIGSITVLLNGFPVQEYQDFLNSYMGGALRNIIQTIQTSTVGILAIYITAALNFSYINQTKEEKSLVLRFGSLLGCINGFFILVGFFSGEAVDASLLSGQGVFSALLAGIMGSVLFRKFEKIFVKRKTVFVDGADAEFSAALQVILPFLCVTLCFAVVNYLITICFQVQSVQHLFMKAMDAVFFRMRRSYSSGLLFTSLTSIMWWFGIHGNNVLNQVAEDMFTAIIPGEIVSKSFIDSFVNMGGTGCTIGLLIAMVIFGKRSSTRKLTGMALLPGVFNIGELMVFGFPVIYNPVMFIPFILAPLLCFTNAYLLTAVGILPQVTNEVIWTTPALMSGYLATGSVVGILVQLINILISTACYAPFVIRYEKKSLHDFSAEMDRLVDILKKSQKTKEEVVLTECEGNVGRLAKLLAIDLEAALDVYSKKTASDITSDNAESQLMVEYRQYDDGGQCIGVKAYLNYDHKLHGSLYSPLIYKIAEESDNLYELEAYVIEKSVGVLESYRLKYGNEFKITIPVTISTVYDKRFIGFLQKTAQYYKLKAGDICIEIAGEECSLKSEEMNEMTERIRVFGFEIFT